MGNRVFNLLLCFILSNIVILGSGSIREKSVKKEVRNRQVIKTIQSEDGDIFECIDIYSQPAFDNPLLQNHTIQMTPSFHPADIDTISSDLAADVERIACPQGAIPIWKHNEEYYSSKFSSSRNHRRGLRHNVTDDVFGYNMLMAAMEMPNKTNLGTRAVINVYQPTVKPYQLSGAGMYIGSGGGNDFIEIVTGWFVLYEGNSSGPTRFHILTYDGHTNTSCMDLDCSSFIHVQSSIALGAKIKPVSSYNGKQYQITLSIHKDTKTGNWMLLYGENNILIGYWPANFFPGDGSFIVWGGEVTTPSDQGSPEMGSGHPPEEGFGKAAYFKNVMFLNENNELVVPNLKECFARIDNITCYGVSKTTESDKGIGFYFGGTGGC